ncbi:MAG TPA: CHAT domain-containing protein [Thermoanaerobaculia bacterium]
MRRLAAAAPRDVRFVEARVSGGFRWAPLARTTRGRTKPRSSPALAGMSEVTRGAGSSSQHAAAVVHLLGEQHDAAIAQLAAMAEERDDAAIWNDLGAANHDAAVRSGSMARLQDALAAVDQALLFDPGFSEALFNRALILERFFLRDAAAAAWRDFLAQAARDGWRDEAQQHLDALTAPQRTVASEIGSHYPRLQNGDGAAARELLYLDAGDTRMFGQTVGLARWGEAWRNKDRDADRHVAALRTLAAELKQFSGEALLSESVDAIERADNVQRDALAHGHIAFRDARVAYDRRKMAEAEQKFQDAARALGAGSSPLAIEARLYAAAARFWQHQHDEAVADYRALLPLIPERHAALRANVDWLLASCFITRADTGRSLAHLGRAIEAFTRLGETNTAAYLQNMTAQVYDGIGDHRRADHHRVLALRVLGSTSDHRLVHTINGMTYAAVTRKQWRAARSFLTVQLDANAKAHDAELQIVALLRRVRLHGHLGDRAAAEADLNAAKVIAAAVPDRKHREKLQIDCDAAAALLSNDPRTAIVLLTDALAFHGKNGSRRLMPQMYLRRGRMYLALADHVRAASDFESGIALLESQRETVEKGEQRWGVLDAAEELFDEAIAEALRAGAEPAFEYAERKRARSLSDDVLTDMRAFDRTLLPQGTLLIEYASLPGRLLIFVVDRDGCAVREVKITRAQLSTLAEQHTSAMRHGDAAQRRKLAAQLSDILIAPVRAQIASHREVAFITDAATAGIAFAALPGVTPGRMLVEDVTFSVSPCARLYLASRTRGVRDRSKVLIVDDPENAALERLAGTRDEATAVNAVYPRARRLSGPNATRAAFTRESREANIIHFAGHGVSGIESASLILTETPGDAGIFDAAAISRLSLRDTDVVVLAACDTARGPIRSAEGVLSVTHAFLQAGTPTVIATLWPLEDRQAAAFFPLLHRHLARGIPASEALRQAQLEWIRSSPEDRSALWAAVQTIGY